MRLTEAARFAIALVEKHPMPAELEAPAKTIKIEFYLLMTKGLLGD